MSTKMTLFGTRWWAAAYTSLILLVKIRGTTDL